jgi:hypothetical protein
VGYTTTATKGKTSSSKYEEQVMKIESKTGGDTTSALTPSSGSSLLHTKGEYKSQQ